MTTEDTFADWVPLAALDGLDGEDRVAFETHLRSCTQCDRALRDDRALLHRLPLTLPTAIPSPDLKRRVLEAVAAEEPRGAAETRHSEARAVPWVTALATLATAAVLVLGVALVGAKRERDQARRIAEADRRTTEALEAEVQGARDALARARSRLDDGAPVRPDAGASERAAGDAQDRVVALERRLGEELEKARQAVDAREQEIAQQREALTQSEQRSRAEAEAARQDSQGLATQLRTMQADLAEVRQRLEKETAFRELVAHPDSRVTALTGIAAGSRARARVVWNPSSRAAVLLVSGLPKAPEGKAYEVWVISKEGSTPAGLFQVDPEGRALFTLPTLAETARVKTFAVTIEPTGGRPAPSGPMVLAGAVS